MLRNDQGIRLGGAHGFAEFFPEAVVIRLAVSKVSRDIQSPSVRIVRRKHPLGRNGKNIILQFG